MKEFPSIPGIADAPPELLDGGHLWIQEKVDGAPLRFRVRNSGLLVFGDRSRTYEDSDVPEPYRHAVRHVRARFDRDAFRASVDDVEAFVFFGEAMHRHAVDYDWDRTPSFLGFDVWSERRGAFLPPDVVERAFERLGLDAVDAFEKEVRAVDFDPATYEVPQSRWYDGPAEGVVVRNKNGARATLRHPRFDEVDERPPFDASPRELAGRLATDRRIEEVVRRLDGRGIPVEFDAVFERVVEDIVREVHDRLFHPDVPVDVRAFRSAVAARTRRYLEGRAES